MIETLRNGEIKMNMIELYQNIIIRKPADEINYDKIRRAGILLPDKSIDAMVLWSIGTMPLNGKKIAVAVPNNSCVRQPCLRLNENGVITLNQKLDTEDLMRSQLDYGERFYSKEEEDKYQEERNYLLGPLAGIEKTYWVDLEGCSLFEISKKELGAMHNFLLKH
jgi:hypothetical protein